MAFYDYIILDGYRYKTLAKVWKPSVLRPATARMTLGGTLEATFAPATMKRWEGAITVPHGESAPGVANGTLPGNVFTLRASLAKSATVLFTDHNGNAYTCVCQGPYEEQSIVNVWNSASNRYLMHLVITAI